MHSATSLVYNRQENPISVGTDQIQPQNRYKLCSVILVLFVSRFEIRPSCVVGCYGYMLPLEGNLEYEVTEIVSHCGRTLLITDKTNQTARNM